MPYIITEEEKREAEIQVRKDWAQLTTSDKELIAKLSIRRDSLIDGDYKNAFLNVVMRVNNGITSVGALL